MDRRTFLKFALAGTAALATSGIPLRHAWAAAAQTTRDLRIVRRTIDVRGRAATVFGLVDGKGRSGLDFRDGDTFDVTLHNETPDGSIVHWHGLTPPWAQDGVAGAPMPLLAANAARDFNFPVGKAGTFWMHAHTLQEQALLAAPLIIRERDARDEQEVVILLHDFSFTPPEELLQRLQQGQMMGAGADMAGHAGMAGMHGAMPGMAMGGSMAMDLNDIEYDAYLANDRSLDDPEIVAVERGGRVRVRIINGATATAFTMDFGSLSGTLIAVDGQDIEPVTGSRFPLAMGQRIDVRLQLPSEARAFPILALREGEEERTGIILRPAGAPVEKLASIGDGAPVLDLLLEEKLHARSPLTPRAADKAFDMTLSGGMGNGYVWGLETPVPIRVARGDRVEVTMRNRSMMAHPMHLHGHHFQVVGVDGRRFSGAVRDTVNVPPMQAVTIAVDADNPGHWAFHCHHLYHMAAGMMSTFAYS